MASITIRLDEKEKEILIAMAQKNDLSLSQVVRRAIKEFLEKQ